jgi:hypothetical protein
MIKGGVRRSERREIMERDDEEGRRRCLNTFWTRAVGRRVAVSVGLSLLDEKWKTEDGCKEGEKLLRAHYVLI